MRTPMKALVTSAVVLATSATAFAHPDRTEPGNHWLDHLAPTQPTQQQLAPLGYASKGPAEREVNLTSGLRHLNVVAGETVRFIDGGKDVSWRFDTLGNPTFLLSEVIPGAPRIEVHVSPDLLYSGG